jgi:serine/threonine-protein kinase
MSDKDDRTIGYGELAEEAAKPKVIADTGEVPEALGQDSSWDDDGAYEAADDGAIQVDDLQEKIIEKLEQHDGRIKEDPLIGQVIAERFRIEARVGSGGMGAVYRAEQIGMERRIALKVLRPQYSDNEGVRRRFHLEALAASRLTHPNTIRIYDFGETDEQVLYIAMEFLKGRGLATVIGTEKVLSVKRLIHLMSKVCESLAEAHRNNVVHRDLKPDNIFLCVVENDSDYVKVLDFGVAKIITEANQGRAGTLTEAGHLFGTPRYMAPEQCRSELVDGRTDIYALGVIMFQCLTGVLPFSDENPIGIMMWHLQRDPPPFMHASPTIRVPEPIEAIVQRCMKKDPNLRFDTVEDLRKALLRVGDGLSEEWESVQRRGPEELEKMDLSEAQTALAYPQDQKTQVARPIENVGLSKHWVRWMAFVLVLGTGLGAYLYLRSGQLPVPATPNLSAVIAPVQALSMEVPAKTHRLGIESTPADVEVWHGTRLLGRTPLSLRRKPGEKVRFNLKNDGYEDGSIYTDFSEDNQSLSIVLNKKRRGSVPQSPRENKATREPKVDPYRPTRIEDFKRPGE